MTVDQEKLLIVAIGLVGMATILAMAAHRGQVDCDTYRVGVAADVVYVTAPIGCDVRAALKIVDCNLDPAPQCFDDEPVKVPFGHGGM